MPVPVSHSLSGLMENFESSSSSASQLDHAKIDPATLLGKSAASAPAHTGTATEELGRNYNTAHEIQALTAAAGASRNENRIDKTLFLGFLAGNFVGLAGLLSIYAAGLIDPETRASQPIVHKLLFGSLFPIGLFFIVLFGGELFTGNTMVMAVSFFNRRVTLFQLVRNWSLVFVSNLIGCFFSAFVFGYLTEVLTPPSVQSFIVALVVNKCNLKLHVALFRAIPANVFVCLAVFLGLASRDVVGKIVGMWWPIFAFAVLGFEHCVANMFYFSVGILYGVNVPFSSYVINIAVVVLGNIVGGGLLVGGSEYYLYHWRDSRSSDSRMVRIGIASHFAAFESNGVDFGKARLWLRSCLGRSKAPHTAIAVPGQNDDLEMAKVSN